MRVITLVSVICVITTFAAPQHGPDHNACIVKYTGDNEGTDYNYGFETSNRISHQESGRLVNVGTDRESMSVRGQFSFLGVDGVFYVVNYIADENGFQPQGAHLPR